MFSLKTYSKTLIPLCLAAVLFSSCADKETKTVTEETKEATPEMTVDQKKLQLQNASPSQGSNVKTMDGLNPPHGEPGHRCEIPVGAPLDGSAPAPQMKVTPAKSPSTGETAADKGPKPKMNPPHGEPWHRCDIKVGEPL